MRNSPIFNARPRGLKHGFVAGSCGSTTNEFLLIVDDSPSTRVEYCRGFAQGVRLQAYVEPMHDSNAHNRGLMNGFFASSCGSTANDFLLVVGDSPATRAEHRRGFAQGQRYFDRLERPSDLEPEPERESAPEPAPGLVLQPESEPENEQAPEPDAERRARASAVEPVEFDDDQVGPQECKCSFFQLHGEKKVHVFFLFYR